jgi:hypothetical protein
MATRPSTSTAFIPPTSLQFLFNGSSSTAFGPRPLHADNARLKKVPLRLNDAPSFRARGAHAASMDRAGSSLAFDEFVEDILENHVIMEVRGSSLPAHNLSRTTAIVTEILEGYGAEASDVT